MIVNSKNIPNFAAANRKIATHKCNRGVVQLASILAWGASGRPFESGHSDKRATEFSAALFVFDNRLKTWEYSKNRVLVFCSITIFG